MLGLHPISGAPISGIWRSASASATDSVTFSDAAVASLTAVATTSDSVAFSDEAVAVRVPVPPVPTADDIALIGAQSRKARLRLQREQEERAALARQIVITSIAQLIASGVLDE